MPYKDIDPENRNMEAGAKASDAVSEKTGGRIRKPDSDELWELWYKVYEENGGKVRIIEEKGESSTAMLIKCEPPSVRRPLPIPPKPREIPPLKLKIVELEFLSDHNVIKDNDANWKKTGAVYVVPDWTPDTSNIVSHNMNTRATVRVVIEAEGEAPDAGQIAAELNGKRYFLSATKTFIIGRNEFTLISEKVLSNKLVHGELVFNWFATTTRDPGPTPIGDTENYVLITFSDPVSRPSEPDDAVTVKRMKRSIDFIRKTGETEPHEIVKKLMGAFDSYTLRKNPAVPDELGHPQYTNAEIGAWALADYAKHTAECQAICRFVRGVLDQVGCPGTVEPTVVWEDPIANAVKEAAYGASRSGLRFVMKTVMINVEITEAVKVTEELSFFDKLQRKEPVVRTVQTKKTVPKPKTWSAFLTTSAATVGADANSCGLNLYEACLKFTHSGVTKYHGGGAGVFDSKEEVIRAFHSLIWISREENPLDRDGELLLICREIVKTF